MNKLDLDTKIEEIKELVTTPDYDMIDKGVTLARELNEPAVFETLLEGCRIHIDKEKDYNFPLIPGELFRGDDNNQHYLNYALLNLIGYAPENANIDHSIKKENLTLLQLTYYSWCTISQELRLITKLEKFPVGICSLINLTKINLSDCSLKYIPPEIGNLKKLEEVNLTGNNIGILPDEIGELACLKKLFLDGNKLKTLPKTIQQLTNLEDNGGLWIWDMDDLKVPENIQEFVHSKIMADYIFQLELIRWACNKTILVRKFNTELKLDEYRYNNFSFYSPEDLQGESNEEYVTEWEKLLNDIASHAECPYHFLIQFVNSDSETYWRDSGSLVLMDIALQQPNLKKRLNPAGFGRFTDPDTGEVIAKMQDGKLVPVTGSQ